MATAGSMGSKVGEVRPMTEDEKRVIFASSLGTVFEWYDFYLFGVMSAIIANSFFTALDPATRDIFTLLAFAAGFAVRPFGAIVFGRLGDLVGRKYTFLVTILIMGLSTFLVGLLPGSATWGIAAPVTSQDGTKLLSLNCAVPAYACDKDHLLKGVGPRLLAAAGGISRQFV